jgi:ribosome biogenesis GTPase
MDILKKELKGIVTKSTGSWYRVRVGDFNTLLEARIVGKFRLKNMVLTNPVAVGDEVTLRQERGDWLITKISQRKNYVARQSPRQRHQLHLLAANIEQVVLFVTIVEPMLKIGFIDRFLLMTEPQNIPTIIVFNKADLYFNSEEGRQFFENVSNIYQKIGYKTLALSALTGEGVAEFKAILKDKITLLAGQSGVGKSSAVNAVEPNLRLRTGEISDYSGKGQHTTTFAEMHTLSFGGFLIDTPGIKTLAFNNLEPLEVAQNFREFFALSPNCRFGADCLHRNEPQCAVKNAVTERGVAESRYHTYLQLLEEIEDQNYWERHKEI